MSFLPLGTSWAMVSKTVCWHSFLWNHLRIPLCTSKWYCPMACDRPMVSKIECGSRMSSSLIQAATVMAFLGLAWKRFPLNEISLEYSLAYWLHVKSFDDSGCCRISPPSLSSPLLSYPDLSWITRMIPFSSTPRPVVSKFK